MFLLFSSKQSAKVAFSDLQASLKRLLPALPLEEDNIEAHTQLTRLGFFTLPASASSL